MPFFLPLAILSGTSSLVPYVGPLVVGAAITLFALVTGGVWIALATAIYFVVYGQLEGSHERGSIAAGVASSKGGDGANFPAMGSVHR